MLDSSMKPHVLTNTLSSPDSTLRPGMQVDPPVSPAKPDASKTLGKLHGRFGKEHVSLGNVWFGLLRR